MSYLYKDRVPKLDNKNLLSHLDNKDLLSHVDKNDVMKHLDKGCLSPSDTMIFCHTWTTRSFS